MTVIHDICPLLVTAFFRPAGVLFLFFSFSTGNITLYPFQANYKQMLFIAPLLQLQLTNKCGLE